MDQEQQLEKDVSETQKGLSYLWRVIIFCIAAILIGSTAAVIVGVFVGLPNITPLVTLFTAALALLGGLLAPSPIQEAIRTIAELRLTLPIPLDWTDRVKAMWTRFWERGLLCSRPGEPFGRSSAP